MRIFETWGWAHVKIEVLVVSGVIEIEFGYAVVLSKKQISGNLCNKQTNQSH